MPLVCWAGLERPFSTPKMWLLVGLDAVVAVRYLGGVEWPWLVWLGTVALSALAAPYVSLEALLLTVLAAPLFWAGRLPVERLKRAILWGSVVESAIVLLQYARFDPLRLLGWQPEVFASPRMRVYGTLGNPDFVAAWLCATLPLFTGLRRRYAIAGAAVQLGAIMATGSRVFLLAFPVAAVVLALRGMRPKKWWAAGVLAAGALLWLSPARPLSVTVEGRWHLARVTMSHWREIPLLGNGPGSFERQFAQWQSAGVLDHAHNDYLELWVDYGPVGLCAFLGLCGWLMVKAWRRRADGGAWGALASLLVVACVDFPFHRPAEWGLYWLLLGMLGAQTGSMESESPDA